MGRGRMATPGTCCALEHRFQALSINHGSLSPSQASLKEEACFHGKDDIAIQQQHHNQNSSHKDALEPKSMPDLSSQREQFLDLKTGELYFDSSAGRRTKSHSKDLLRISEKVLVSEEIIPSNPGIVTSTPLYYSEEEDFDSMDGETTGSERSQQEASEMHETCEGEEEAGSSSCSQDATVLVAAGCQSCLMYYMLPKHAISCPKCGTSLLHFNEPATSKDKEIPEVKIG